MKYSICQISIVPGSPKENREKIDAWLNTTMKEEEPDTVVLPEMWTTAYALEELEHLADIDGEPTISFLKALARKNNVNIIGGSFANKKEEKIYNSSVVINRKGNMVHQYDKLHLVPMLKEHLYLTGGEIDPKIFELDGIKMGVIICYDLRFPELIRKLALEGAQIIHIVAEWPSERKDHWKILQMARAIENQMFVVSSNTVGEHENVDFPGNSMIIDPWGEILKQGENKEQTISATLSLEKVSEIRNTVPVFSSRVPEYY